MVVIGRDFPSSHGTMHPVAQFNITYAYSIVSRRRRRNRKGLCTPARLARDAQEGQKLVLHSNFLPDSCESCLAQPSFHQVALLDDYAAIYRDLSRHGLPAELATLVPRAERIGRSCRRIYNSCHRAIQLLDFIRVSGVNFQSVGTFFIYSVYRTEYSFSLSFRS